MEPLDKLGNTVELIDSLVVERKDVLVVDDAAVLGAGENGEGRLVAVVGKEKLAGGGDPEPTAADGAATEEGIWREADEYLPNEDLLRETAERRRPSCP